MDREIKIITTEDGSHSLYLPHLNETYHSSHGALTESEHVFIAAGLQHFQSLKGAREIRVLEVGFGTGLNALLAERFATKTPCEIHFTSLEPYPLTQEVYGQLNYASLMGEVEQERFMALHKANWDEVVAIDTDFKLEKLQTRLEDFQTDDRFDVIFFDAFAPSKQAELWGLEILDKTVGLMAASGVLVTYCAKGQFKRDLAALGLKVETLPGPPGKKEMVRATLN